MSQLAVLDCGSGNLTSVCHAFERLGTACDVVSSPADLNHGMLVLPGQGRFGTVMQALRKHGWENVLVDWIGGGKKFLGICVGMQVLFESSAEDDGVAGLGILPGRVSPVEAAKSPMMGWSGVCWLADYADWPTGSAYFVNGFVVRKSAYSIASSEYAQAFCSAVKVNHAMAFQFHPEKSGHWGQEVLKRWLDS